MHTHTHTAHLTQTNTLMGGAHTHAHTDTHTAHLTQTNTLVGGLNSAAKTSGREKSSDEAFYVTRRVPLACT